MHILVLKHVQPKMFCYNTHKMHMKHLKHVQHVLFYCYDIVTSANTCNMCLTQLQHGLETHETFTMINCNMNIYTCDLVQQRGGSTLPVPNRVMLHPSTVGSDNVQVRSDGTWIPIIPSLVQRTGV